MGGLRIPRAEAELVACISRLGAEAGAEAYLKAVRWPGGVTCPRCESDRVGWIEERRKHYCRDCRYHFRTTAGTVLHDSHVPALKWLLAVGLMLDSEDGFPANRLHKLIGGSYKTAWFVEHRIRAAMARALHADAAAIAVAQASHEQSRSGRLSEAAAEQAPEPVIQGYRLIKGLATGAYHRLGDEHLGAYWAELRWRLEQEGEGAFRRTVEALIDAGPLRYDELTRRRRATQAH